MIVNTSDDFEARGWTLQVIGDTVHLHTDDGCNNQTVDFQLSREEAGQLAVDLAEASKRPSAPYLRGCCRVGLHAECGGHGAVHDCDCSDPSHTAPEGESSAHAGRVGERSCRF